MPVNESTGSAEVVAQLRELVEVLEKLLTTFPAGMGKELFLGIAAQYHRAQEKLARFDAGLIKPNPATITAALADGDQAIAGLRELLATAEQYRALFNILGEARGRAAGSDSRGGGAS
ncbi:MAG: hypothetical protein D3X82_16775 [Candidatus Leucobacter sulfamidivorax]|nr:hypothetical protein [Candidatus Leucobacter sulfamidivorax]